MTLLLLFTMALAGAAQQQAEKELIVTISGPQLKGGLVSEITWDGGTLLLQGIFAELGGELKAQYFVVPAESTKLEQRDTQTDASLEYWRKKASRTSPTGLGRIEIGSDTKMPQFGIGGLERRINDAVEMGGTQTTIIIKLGPSGHARAHGARTVRWRVVVVVAGGAQSRRLCGRQGRSLGGERRRPQRQENHERKLHAARVVR